MGEWPPLFDGNHIRDVADFIKLTGAYKCSIR